MKISSKGEYGLLALVDLALHAHGQTVQVAQIAKRQSIPKQYLDQLLIALKGAGLVASSRGRRGGYQLARPAESITLLDAVRALEGPMKNTSFQGRSQRARNPRTVLRGIWNRMTSAAEATLRSRTLAEIATECSEQESADMYVI